MTLDVSTIIVVEENRLLRCAIVANLKRQGYSVLEVISVTSALEFMKRQSAHAVLLDMHPLTESAFLLRQMRSLPVLAQVPVVAMIAANSSLDALDYLEPGMWLRLPFDMQFLDWLLRKLLAPQEASQMLQTPVLSEKEPRADAQL